jgi:uncharacterized protein
MVINNHSLVIVPGHGNSGPGPWQTQLEQSHFKAVRVIQKNWNLPIRWQWTISLDRTLSALGSPAILVGHSAGAMTIAHWASRTRSHAMGALLVAPPLSQIFQPVRRRQNPPPRTFSRNFLELTDFFYALFKYINHTFT